jgi:Effector-associated domain 5
MSFAHLKPERVKEIKAAFDNEDPYDDDIRNLMLKEIQSDYVQRLRVFDSNLNQLTGDLNSLNSLPKLADGQIPFEKWLEKGVDDVFAGSPKVTRFKAALDELRAGPFQPSDTDVIVEGIDALVELIKTNNVAYSAVIFYRKTFETALWDIDVIASYKIMHDGLHKLQLNWPETPVLTVLLASPNTQLTLVNYSASLHETIGELRTSYDNGYVDGAEKTWIDEIDKDQVQLQNVLEADQPEGIKDAFNTVRGLLTRQLSLLNTRLKAAINKLHLDLLIKAMSDVCDALTNIAPANTSEQIQQYKSGIDELTKLESRLRDLITQHDDWQGTDTLLRTLGDTLKIGDGQTRNAMQESERLANLRFIKTIIETKVGPLLSGKSTFWSKRLLDSAQRFGVEVERSNTDMAEQAFDMYRQQAWHFFFEIDSEMKERCEELRRIGQRLRKVNDQLKFNDEL